MEYIYAAMLIHKAGGKIDEASVKKVLEAAGVQVDDGKVKALVASLDGVDIETVVKEAAVAPVPREFKLAAVIDANLVFPVIVKDAISSEVTVKAVKSVLPVTDKVPYFTGVAAAVFL